MIRWQPGDPFWLTRFVMSAALPGSGTRAGHDVDACEVDAEIRRRPKMPARPSGKLQRQLESPADRLLGPAPAEARG